MVKKRKSIQRQRQAKYIRDYRARNWATESQVTIVQEAALTEADVREKILSMCGKEDTVDKGKLHEAKRLKRW